MKMAIGGDLELQKSGFSKSANFPENFDITYKLT